MNGLLLASSHENKDIKLTAKNISNTQDNLLKNQNDFFQNLMENLLHEEPDGKNKKFLIAKILDLPEDTAQNAEIRSLFSREPLIKEHHIDKVSLESLIQLAALLRQNPQDPLPYFPTDSKALKTALLDLSVQQEFLEAKTVGDLLKVAQKHHISIKNFTFFKEEAAVDLHAKKLVKKINSEEILKIIKKQAPATDTPVPVNEKKQHLFTAPKHVPKSPDILQKLLVKEEPISSHVESVMKTETDISKKPVTPAQKTTPKIPESDQDTIQTKSGNQEQIPATVQKGQHKTATGQPLPAYATDKTVKNHAAQEQIITHKTIQASQQNDNTDKTSKDPVTEGSIRTKTAAKTPAIHDTKTETTPAVQNKQPETAAKQPLPTHSADKTVKNHGVQEQTITHKTSHAPQVGDKTLKTSKDSLIKENTTIKTTAKTPVKPDNYISQPVAKSKKLQTDNTLQNNQPATLSSTQTKHTTVTHTETTAFSSPENDLKSTKSINLAPSGELSEREENSSSSTSEPSLHEEKISVSHETKTTSTHQSKPHHLEFKRTLNTFAQDFREQVENYKAPLMKIKMQLNPGNLGDVDVTLINRGNNLHVTINSNPSTIAIFSQNQTEFKNALVNMGFTGLQMSFGESKEQNREQQHKPNTRNSERQSEEIQEIDHFEMIVPRYV